MAEKIKQLQIGEPVRGRIQRVGLYGALIDIGTGQDALLHISELSNGADQSGADEMKTGDEVSAFVLKTRKDGHIALTLEKPPAVPWQSIKQGKVFTGQVVRVEKFGIFVDIGAERPGMVHVSEMADGFVRSPSDIASVGQEVEVRVIKKSGRPRQIDLSMKMQIDEQVAQDEDVEAEEEMPTAMAQAFQRAMKGSEDREARLESQPLGQNKLREQQEAILERTLRGSTS